MGAGKAAYEQACKWAQYRYQFDRPIAGFQLVQQKLVDMIPMHHGTTVVEYFYQKARRAAARGPG